MTLLAIGLDRMNEANRFKKELRGCMELSLWNNNIADSRMGDDVKWLSRKLCIPLIFCSFWGMCLHLQSSSAIPTHTHFQKHHLNLHKTPSSTFSLTYLSYSPTFFLFLRKFSFSRTSIDNHLQRRVMELLPLGAPNAQANRSLVHLAHQARLH